MSLPAPQRLVGIVSGMIVWAVWFVLVYSLTGVGCQAGWQLVRLPFGNLLSLLMLLSTLLALALIGWCAWRGLIALRETRRPPSSGADTSRRHQFMALVMLLLSFLAGLGTVLIAVPILMLDPCVA